MQDKLYDNIYPNYAKDSRDLKGLKKVLKRFLPVHLIRPVIIEYYLYKNRVFKNRQIRKFKDAKGIKLNIGCGSSGLDNWVNVDMFKFEKVNCVYDCRKSLPFPSNSSRMIFTEHFFEHIDYTEEVPFFLEDCFRVLEPGGVIRIIVPDFKKYVDAYVSDGWEQMKTLRNMGDDHIDSYFGCKYHTKMELLNVVARQGWEHKFAWDFETMEYVLQKHGFINVVHTGYNKSMLEELKIDNPVREIESLYVEAQKPLN